MTTLNGTDDTDVIPEALAAGLLGIDASRRVGWAKFFEGARHLEDLEAQVSALQSELETLRLCYIRLVGFTNNLPVSLGDQAEHRVVFDAEMRLHKQAIKSYMNRQAFNSGRNEADKHRGIIRDWDDERLKYQEQKQDMYTYAYRESQRELIDKARREGHDARFDAQPDGCFRYSCSCGDEAEVEDDHTAHGLVARHRILVVHGFDDIKRYRKLVKGRAILDRCTCEICGDTHGRRVAAESEPASE